MMAATNKRGQRDMKGATSVCFIFGSFFSSNKSAEAEMGVGAEIIGVVKTNTKGFLRRPLRILQIIVHEILN